MTTTTLPPREWLTLTEAAEWTGLSKSTVTRAKNAGLLNPKKTAQRGGKELYKLSDLRAWIDSMEDA